MENEPLGLNFEANTLLTAPFRARVIDYLENYLQDTQVLESLSFDAKRLAEKHLFTPATTTAAQTRLENVYMEILDTARDAVLHLGYLNKNAAFMPAILGDSANAFLEEYYDISLAYWQNEEAHDIEMHGISEQMFENLERIEKCFSAGPPKDLNARLYAEDPYSKCFLKDRLLSRDDFWDWVEYNFFKHFQMPLTLFDPSPAVTHSISHEMETARYKNAVLKNLQSGLLQNTFPGLSLNTKPTNRLDRKNACYQLHYGLFGQPGPKTQVIHAKSHSAHDAFRAINRNIPKTKRPRKKNNVVYNDKVIPFKKPAIKQP